MACPEEHKNPFDPDKNVEKFIGERDKEWAAFIETACGPLSNMPKLENPEDVVAYLKLVFEVQNAGFQLIIQKLQERAKHEQDCRHLVQVGSNADLNEHRTYKGEVGVLLNEILFTLKNSGSWTREREINEYARIGYKMEEFLKR